MQWTQGYAPLGKFAFIGSLRARADYLLLGACGETDEGVHRGAFHVSRFTFNRCICLRHAGGKAVMSASQGAVYGLLPIGWIIVTSVFLYKITVKTGQFEIIRSSVLSITDDRRLQALLIAFSFGAF